MRCQQELERTGDRLRQSLEATVSERQQLHQLHENVTRQLDELSDENQRLQTANVDLQRHGHRLQDEKDDLSREQERQSRDRERWSVHLYYSNVPDAVTLGGAYDGGGDSPAGLQGHVIC